MSKSIVLGIVNRFPASGVYHLGECFTYNGVIVKQLDLQSLTFTKNIDETLDVIQEGERIEVDAILWRLSENVYPATRFLAETLTQQGRMLINPYPTLTLCGDKLSTHQALVQASIPSVDSLPGLPGQVVKEGMIAKPSQGASGRSVIFGDDQATIPLDTMEPWVIQPYAGASEDFIRVLVVNGEALCAYRRIPASGNRVNNIESGGTREFVTLTEELVSVAVRAAEICGAVISGVDLTGAPYKVLEVNSNPGLPPELIRGTADALTRYLLQT